jgi:hypothetical protein
MFLLLCISTTSFTLLNFSKVALRARKRNAINNVRVNQIETLITTSNESFDSKSELNQSSANNSLLSEGSSATDNSFIKFLVDKRGTNDKMEKIVLNFYIFIVSFICYGVLPGLQSYSTLPYGNDVFNYAVNVSFVFIPVAVLLSIWSYDVTILQISVSYFIFVLFLSP